MRTQIPPSPRPDVGLPDQFAVELDSFLLSLEAENLAPKTRRVIYLSSSTLWPQL